MSKLPDTKSNVETLQAKVEAVDMVDGIIKRNMELEEIFQCLQPLLYALSIKMYGEDASPRDLGTMTADAVHYVNGTTGETMQ